MIKYEFNKLFVDILALLFHKNLCSSKNTPSQLKFTFFKFGDMLKSKGFPRFCHFSPGQLYISNQLFGYSSDMIKYKFNKLFSLVLVLVLRMSFGNWNFLFWNVVISQKKDLPRFWHFCPMPLYFSNQLFAYS